MKYYFPPPPETVQKFSWIQLLIQLRCLLSVKQVIQMTLIYSTIIVYLIQPCHLIIATSCHHESGFHHNKMSFSLCSKSFALYLVSLVSHFWFLDVWKQCPPTLSLARTMLHISIISHLHLHLCQSDFPAPLYFNVVQKVSKILFLLLLSKLSLLW